MSIMTISAREYSRAKTVMVGLFMYKKILGPGLGWPKYNAVMLAYTATRHSLRPKCRSAAQSNTFQLTLVSIFFTDRGQIWTRKWSRDVLFCVKFQCGVAAFQYVVYFRFCIMTSCLNGPYGMIDASKAYTQSESPRGSMDMDTAAYTQTDSPVAPNRERSLMSTTISLFMLCNLCMQWMFVICCYTIEKREYTNVCIIWASYIIGKKTSRNLFLVEKFIFEWLFGHRSLWSGRPVWLPDHRQSAIGPFGHGRHEFLREQRHLSACVRRQQPGPVASDRYCQRASSSSQTCRRYVELTGRRRRPTSSSLHRNTPAVGLLAAAAVAAESETAKSWRRRTSGARAATWRTDAGRTDSRRRRRSTASPESPVVGRRAAAGRCPLPPRRRRWPRRRRRGSPWRTRSRDIRPPPQRRRSRRAAATGRWRRRVGCAPGAPTWWRHRGLPERKARESFDENAFAYVNWTSKPTHTHTHTHTAENSSRINVRTHTGSTLHNRVTLTYWAQGQCMLSDWCVLCLPTLVLIAPVVFLLEHGQAHVDKLIDAPDRATHATAIYAGVGN